MVIVEVGQSRIDLFRAQVGMLSQQFFRRPTVVVMLGRKMLDLVACVANPCGAVVGNDDVWIGRGGTDLRGSLDGPILPFSSRIGYADNGAPLGLRRRSGEPITFGDTASGRDLAVVIGRPLQIMPIILRRCVGLTRGMVGSTCRSAARLTRLRIGCFAAPCKCG